MRYPWLPSPNPAFFPLPRFHPGAFGRMSQTHGFGKGRHRHSAVKLQRVNLQHLYTVTVAPQYLAQWRQRRQCWQKALERPFGGSRVPLGLLKHQRHQRQSPQASHPEDYLAPLHHRGRFW